MRTETISIYTFDELNDAAKEKAREWYKNGMEYFWWTDALESIKAFCDGYNVTIKDYSVGPFERSWITTDATNEKFRGVKLRDVPRDDMPTGYCLDCALWQTFHDEFKRTGDALRAFNEAIDAAVAKIVAEMEYQYTDESVDENILCNEYEFLENGERA
jgi:hypothetical protein